MAQAVPLAAVDNALTYQSTRLGRLLDQWKRFEPDKFEPGLKLLEDQLQDEIGRETKAEPRRILAQQLEQLKLRGDRATIGSRILDGVSRTNSGPMDRLARLGWYSVARSQRDLEGTLFGHILTGAEFADIVPEAQYKREKEKYDAQHEPKDSAKVPPIVPGAYWTDWEQIDGWEKSFDEMLKKNLDLRA